MTDYLILEVETGLVDGIYKTRHGLDGILKRWHERRPQYAHLIVRVECFEIPKTKKYWSIPDHVFLPNKTDNEFISACSAVD
ncbi:MAG: hypothetical protein H6995_14535 [Pseudomonadales bacterium]|nr:hypothetical protein [Pseudomonadales bacterium]MCP5216215.1 hypothetical protein [Pseudomonadales bacterium]